MSTILNLHRTGDIYVKHVAIEFSREQEDSLIDKEIGMDSKEEDEVIEVVGLANLIVFKILQIGK